jgi:hypothetical protein
LSAGLGKPIKGPLLQTKELVMTKITRVQYREEIESLAKQVTQHAREHDEHIDDVLRETIGRHEWVLYYFYHQYVNYLSGLNPCDIDPGLAAGLNPFADHDKITSIRTYEQLCHDVCEHEAYDSDEEE